MTSRSKTVVVGKELLQDMMLVVPDLSNRVSSAFSASWVGVGSLSPHGPSRKTRENVEFISYKI